MKLSINTILSPLCTKNENPSLMTCLARKNDWIYNEESKDVSKIGDSCYVFSSCSTNKKRKVLTYLFKEFHSQANILEFELEPLVEKVTDFNEE